MALVDRVREQARALHAGRALGTVALSIPYLAAFVVGLAVRVATWAWAAGLTGYRDGRGKRTDP